VSELLSVVVPCYNEEACLSEAHTRLTAAVEQIPDLDFELIYVDDGSNDSTLERLREIHKADSRVRVLSLSRNFGKEVASTAGIQQADGDAVVLIDADLQDPPEVIAEMVERWREGAQVAYGVRVQRAGETRLTRLTSSVFYRVLEKLSDTPVSRDTGDFRLMDRVVVDAFLAMPEYNRFVRAMVDWTGYRRVAVPLERDRRSGGRTKWSLRKRASLAVTGISSFSNAPLRLATWLGLASALLALAGLVYALAGSIFAGTEVSGWTALFIALVFLGGTQLVCIGVLGEYVGRVYSEVKRRPLFMTKERLGFDNDSAQALRDGPIEASTDVPGPAQP